LACSRCRANRKENGWQAGSQAGYVHLRALAGSDYAVRCPKLGELAVECFGSPGPIAEIVGFAWGINKASRGPDGTGDGSRAALNDLPADPSSVCIEIHSQAASATAHAASRRVFVLAVFGLMFGDGFVGLCLT
jgi:hypothetical protein